jgi:hypothetical protein
MSRISHTAEGFRAAWRRPALTLAEIMWRWTVGATAAALLAFASFEYLRTLPVTNGELLFLRTRQPLLVGQVLAHILRGSANRVVVAGLVAALSLCGLWILAASAGRLATVRELLEYFAARRKVMGADFVPSVVIGVDPGRPTANFGALLRLNFLRAAVTLAAALSLVGAAIVAGFASPASDPQPGVVFSLFLPVGVLVGCVWSMLNWLLSLAPVFAVRDGEDAAGAIVAAVAFFREHTGPVFSVGTWTGLLHLAALAGASSVVAMPLGFAPILPWRVVAAGMILLSLAYFALADWLYIARLAGYVSIAELREETVQAWPADPVPTIPVSNTIDRDETILSDLPNLALET